MLGHGVGREERGRTEAGERGDVQDVPVPLTHHDRVAGGHAVHDAAHVDVEDALPMGERDLVHLARDADAGVVDEQVETPAGGRLLDGRAHSRRGAHVHGDGTCSRPRCRRHPRGRLTVDIGDDHSRAPSGELEGQRATDARACSGDEGDGVRPRHGEGGKGEEEAKCQNYRRHRARAGAPVRECPSEGPPPLRGSRRPGGRPRRPTGQPLTQGRAALHALVTRPRTGHLVARRAAGGGTRGRRRPGTPPGRRAHPLPRSLTR